MTRLFAQPTCNSSLPLSNVHFIIQFDLECPRDVCFIDLEGTVVGPS